MKPTVDSSERISDQDQARLIALIEGELSWIADAGKRPGWTPWAVALALAALLWKLTETLPQITSWDTVLGSYIILSSTLYVIMVVAAGCSSIDNIGQSPAFTWQRSHRPPKTIKSLALLLTAALMVYGLSQATNKLSVMSVVLASIASLTLILHAVASLSELFRPPTIIPLRRGATRAQGIIALFIALAFAITFAPSVAKDANIILNEDGGDLLHVRSGAMLFIVNILLLMLVPSQPRSQKEFALLSLRRQLLLHSPDISLIKSQLQKLISGESTDDLFSNAAAEFADAATQLVTRASNTNAFCEIVEQKLANDQVEHSEMHILLSAFSAHRLGLSSMVDELDLLVSKLKKQAKFARKLLIHGVDKDEIRAHVEELCDQTNAALDGIKPVIARVGDLEERIHTLVEEPTQPNPSSD